MTKETRKRLRAKRIVEGSKNDLPIDSPFNGFGLLGKAIGQALVHRQSVIYVGKKKP